MGHGHGIFWVDAVGKGQVVNPRIIATLGDHIYSYNQTVPINTSVTGRGSANGLLTANINVIGVVDFDKK